MRFEFLLTVIADVRLSLNLHFACMFPSKVGHGQHIRGHFRHKKPALSTATALHTCQNVSAITTTSPLGAGEVEKFYSSDRR